MGFFDKLKQMFASDGVNIVNVNKRFDLMGRTGQGSMSKVWRARDRDTGRLVWEHDGLDMNPIPSPVAEDGMVFVTAGFRSSKLHAIRLADAKGNLAGSTAIAWTLDRDTPYVPSPLLYDGVLYLLKSNAGILSVFDARSGRPHYRLQRLSGLPEVYSSPVAARGRVYITSRDGTTLVIRHGSRFEPVGGGHKRSVLRRRTERRDGAGWTRQRYLFRCQRRFRSAIDRRRIRREQPADRR